MASLFEPDENNYALSQGLLGLGAGLLSGSFGHYGAFAPALGQGAAGFQQGYGSAINTTLHLRQLKQNKLLQDEQIKNYQSQSAERQFEMDQKRLQLQRMQQAYLDADKSLAPPMAPQQQMPPQMTPAKPMPPDPVSGAAIQIPRQDNMRPPMAIAENQLESVEVPAPRKSNLENPDWYLKVADSLRKSGDLKGATEATLQARKLREEDRNSWKDTRESQVEGVPGLTQRSDATGALKYYEDGKEINSNRVQELKKGQLRAGAMQLNQKIDNYLPASEEAQRDFIKSTRATYDQLKQAPAMINSIEKAKALIPGAKGFMGPGGETLLGAAKFLNNRLGMNINVEGVKNAEELRTRIFFNIMDNLKKMDAQPSQQQQEVMQESLGKLGTDPNALPNVLEAFEDIIREKVEIHNNEVRGAKKNMVKFPYDPEITLPEKKKKNDGVRKYNPETGKIE